MRRIGEHQVNPHLHISLGLGQLIRPEQIADQSEVVGVSAEDLVGCVAAELPLVCNPGHTLRLVLCSQTRLRDFRCIS